MPALRTNVLVLLCVLTSPAQATHLAPVNPADLWTQIDEDSAPLVLDVRTTGEYRSGHVPGAVNIPHTELAARLPELSAGRQSEIVVYCEVGGRAATAERILEEAGYMHVRALEGHMRYWRAQGFPRRQQ